MNMTEVRIVNSASKHHYCSWCGTVIKKGNSYYRYRGFDGYDAFTVKEHPECYDAMIEVSKNQGESIYFSPGEYGRGQVE